MTASSAIQAVVIGNRADEHVAAVVDALAPGTWEVLDAATLPHRRYLLRRGELYIEPDGGSGLVQLGTECRGWLRRFAPPDWQRGVVLDSRDAAVKTAWLTLIAGFARAGGVDWLSALDDVNRAEGKLAQYGAAQRLKISVPDTLVASDQVPLHTALGSRFVLKPLGPGHFVGEDHQSRVVFATETDADAPMLEHLAGAPFLAQQRIDVRLHLRVVTVARQVWACGLDACNAPFDWRRQAATQRSFSVVTPPADVRAGALRLVEHFDLGYSSQDWVLDQSGQAWFLDLNPSGQWLFLPEPVRSAVTRAIAGWLGGDKE
ncbi:hypothetical protein [Dactylosporangium matsuzakiense]|uniref:ATP-grasp ribosomal peptide maturase n=1 Tax=Dactylosporangium matsuzakiense TaxID=53360 RepID=A0A9W6NQ89_9ACTN|nr:hypothetical protein [Dactylosporangium matsuzakiense]GLL05098.1 hypothetical protein GCM10017581_068450 [Dactylosporangium matsuzakiense]